MTRLITILCLLSLTSCQSLWLSVYRDRGGFGAKRVNQPLLIPILHEGKEKYQVAEAWQFPWEDHSEEVPLGLVVDGASVPRAAWLFMPPDGLHRSAALAHDLLYLHRGSLPDGCQYDRAKADLLFYNFMVESGVGRYRAGLAYRCVRAGGWAAWNSVESPVILPVDRRIAASAGGSRRHIFSHIFAP